MKFAQALVAAALGFAASVHALDPVSRAGRYLYTPDGNRFYIKGVAYQQHGKEAISPNGFTEPTSFIDPLVDPQVCQRDVVNLQSLGVNAIRVYSVEPTLNHDQCVSIFEQAGIYLVVDLTQPLTGSISRVSPQWNVELLNVYLTTVDAFLKYTNVLAFTVGNEVVSLANETVAGPFIKAAARDVKAYLKAKGSKVLTTYASTDGIAYRTSLANYLACGSDDDSIDIYGLNNYEWSGNDTISAYARTMSDFQNFNIPAYFSEYGASLNAVSPRPFTEVAALYGDQMTPIFSGGLAFSYFPSSKPGFELVELSTDGSTVTPNQDFANLKAQFAAIQPSNTPSMASVPATSFPACAPPDNVSFFGSDTLPPTPNQAACDCAVSKAFSCVFAPEIVNTSAIIGPLLNLVCGDLANTYHLNSCAIALPQDGAAGAYGVLSTCDPGTQLSYAMSAFYEASGRNPAACDFDGNATINTNAPPNETAASAAANMCLSGPNGATTTVIPSGPATPDPTVPGLSTPTAGGSGGAGRGAEAGTIFAAAVTSIAVLVVGAWSVL